MAKMANVYVYSTVAIAANV